MESSTMGTSTKDHNFTFFIKQVVFFHCFSISASFKDWPLPSPSYPKVVLDIIGATCFTLPGHLFTFPGL